MYFTHYEISENEGGVFGRPLNPFPVSDENYFEFEKFAKDKTYICTTDCQQGVFHREWIYPLRCDLWPEQNDYFYEQLEIFDVKTELDIDGSIVYYYFVYTKRDRILSIPLTYLVN